MSAVSPSPRGTLTSRVAGALTLGWSDRPAARTEIRRVLSRLLRRALRARSRRLGAEAIGAALVVAPHPDDEALGAGGTLALLAAAGLAPQIAYVTDGSASHPHHATVTPGQLGALRRREAEAAAGTLGLAPAALAHLGGPDGRLDSLAPEESAPVVAGLAALLEAMKPNAVLLPCRDDGSTEHEASFRLTMLALRSAQRAPRVLEFPVWAWRNPLKLVRPLLSSRRVWRVDLAGVAAAKAAAVAAHASQVAPFPPDPIPALAPEFLREFQFPEEFFFER